MYEARLKFSKLYLEIREKAFIVAKHPYFL